MPKRTDVTRAPRAFTWRRVIAWTFIVLFVWVVWSRFADLDKLLTTLRSGRPQWIVAALGAQFAYFVLFAGIYWSAFRVVGVRSRMWRLVPLTFASIFINSTVTSGGAAGTVLVVDDVRRRGESAARATAGTVLVMAADYAAYSIFLTIGMISLLRHHEMTKLEGISALTMYVLMFGVLGLLSMGLWSPNGLRRVLWALQAAERSVSRLLRRERPMLSEDWSERNANEFLAAAQAIVRHPILLVQTVSIAVLAHLADLLTLYVLFLAFNQPATLGILIVLYSMTVLFWVVSPTPNGIGVVETVMPAIYVSLGVSLEAATVINLAFRGIGFWLPLLVGFISLRAINASAADDKTD